MRKIALKTQVFVLHICRSRVIKSSRAYFACCFSQIAQKHVCCVNRAGSSKAKSTCGSIAYAITSTCAFVVDVFCLQMVRTKAIVTCPTVSPKSLKTMFFDYSRKRLQASMMFLGFSIVSIC